MLVRALVRARWQETVTLRRFIQSPGCARYLTSGTEESAKKSAKASPDELTLPFLQRPLGVKESPSSVLKTWADTREEMMNQETRLAQREHLMKEATKGYFTDLNATRRHGGKTWIAPKVMIREDKALYFPNIVGSSLDTKSKKHTTSICEGRISVISMLSTRMSEIHVNGFTTPTNTRYLSNPLYQYVQINLQENLLKSFLVSLFLSSIAKSVPPELHPTYLVSSQNMEFLREQLGMVNKHVGYVYLVDDNLKIRWAGCADAKVEETNALEQCTGVLLNRLDKKRSPR
ncbi:ATPase assembly factor ATP10 [Suillus paluster]|uniref:ATPase assembly factor ATP10 n=1 Tax=Suillus paluster TaxID=48578 RepID=UPI001B8794FE|nr:ATPase assembly factor ATP10 [Suillus paluster]KAG1748270.1 ATPase assembly factor ATP10 [Suillus paluster]